MKYVKVISIVWILVFSLSEFAQSVVEKPYNTWGREEAIRIVSDSPWAKPYQSTKGAAAAEAQQIAREQGQTVNRGGSDPRSVARTFAPPPVTLRLHSALPMRQAIVRLQQIDAGYDKMSAADKEAFDKSRKGYLDCPICKDYYVVTLIKAVDSTGSLAEEGILQGFSSADLKGNVKLVNDEGEERELTEFTPPKNARDVAVFFFKRTDAAGKPLYTTQSKYIKFVFSSDFLGSQNRFAGLLPRTFEFKVSKLVVGDKLLF